MEQVRMVQPNRTTPLWRKVSLPIISLMLCGCAFAFVSPTPLTHAFDGHLENSRLFIAPALTSIAFMLIALNNDYSRMLLSELRLRRIWWWLCITIFFIVFCSSILTLLLILFTTPTRGFISDLNTVEILGIVLSTGFSILGSLHVAFQRRQQAQQEDVDAG